MSQQTKDFVLYTEDELHELLRTMSWKSHRRGAGRDNQAHRMDENADIFKCVLSLFQIQGLTPETLCDVYWDKTATVRQRYQEEWVKKVDRPCAIVDIDMVLADYCLGMCQWLLGRNLDAERLSDIIDKRGWVNAATVGVADDEWKRLKHEFRISNGKRALPVFPDAKPFLEALQRRNLQIVLLTSRPIDRYPNIYTDTLLWLQRNQLPFDFIWWSLDKAERVLEGDLRQYVQLVVDDDIKYVQQFERLGMQCFLVDRDPCAVPAEMSPIVHRVTNLRQVVDMYDARIREQEALTWHSTTQTRNTDPTQSTSTRIPEPPSPEAPKR